MREEILNFNIVNNTNGIVPISLFGNNADPMDTANATTQYSWDISGFTITNESLIIIQYKPNSSSTFQLATIGFSGTSIQNVLNALNTLNLGYFFITTSGANTYINNYNNNIAFSNLQILNVGTTSLTYSWNLVGSGGKAQIYVNAVIQVNDTSPITSSGSVSVVGGDTIQFSESATSNPTTFGILNLTTGIYIQNVVLAPSTGSAPTFTITSGNSYFLFAND
jgi:hypothetical protein